MIRDFGTGANYQPAYDGNGNLMALVNWSTGVIDAAYEYDAFGQTLRESGPYGDANPFRFSTKYTDIETGLIYYGRRYYDPKTGRFLGRDPAGESGGLNLSGFLRNNAINQLDYLGMDLVGMRYFMQSIFVLPKVTVTATRSSSPEGSFTPPGSNSVSEARSLVARGGERGDTPASGSSSNSANADDTNTQDPPIVLDPFVVTGTQPIEPTQTPTAASPVTPSSGATETGGAEAPKKAPDKKDDKWDIQKCSDLWDQIQSNNAQFQRYSNDMNNQLDFQRTANWDLFMVDRERQAAFATGFIFVERGIAATRAAFQPAPTTAMVLLYSSGTVQLGSRALIDRTVAIASGPLLNGVINEATSDLAQHPFASGTEGVNGQIENTVNSLDSQTQGVANTLTAQRDAYRNHCQN